LLGTDSDSDPEERVSIFHTSNRNRGINDGVFVQFRQAYSVLRIAKKKPRINCKGVMQISEVQAASGEVSFRAEGNRIFVKGEIAATSSRDFIAAFFELVHNMVLGENLTEVHIDVTDLLFLNSSGIKEFLSWILRRNRLAPGKKYRMNFIYDPTVTWQPITLARLRDLDRDAIMLTPIGATQPIEVATVHAS
jgi:hypothetical protein